ncbi:hypothetical protein JKY79_01735 [Candidatus Babeliales bacterium]|nr:hypothetical protein [Candidatus Babeliales bacterium]
MHLERYNEIIEFCEKQGNESNLYKLYFYHIAQTGAHLYDLAEWIKKNNRATLLEITGLYEAVNKFLKDDSLTYSRRIEAIKKFFKE